MTNHTSMNQQELLTDLLTQEKDLEKDYASGITESSCTNLRELQPGGMLRRPVRRV